MTRTIRVWRQCDWVCAPFLTKFGWVRVRNKSSAWGRARYIQLALPGIDCMKDANRGSCLHVRCLIFYHRLERTPSKHKTHRCWRLSGFIPPHPPITAFCSCQNSKVDNVRMVWCFLCPWDVCKPLFYLPLSTDNKAGMKQRMLGDC